MPFQLLKQVNLKILLYLPFLQIKMLMSLLEDSIFVNLSFNIGRL